MEATMRTTKKVILGALVLSVIGVTPGMSRASECGMGDLDWFSGERERVSRADALLDEGQAREAAAVVESTWARMREARPVASSLPHIADAVRIMALACVRTGGDVPEGNGWSTKTEADRMANVRWGVSRLRMLSSAHPGDAGAKVDLGEALSQSPDTQNEAFTLLEAVDEERLITSAEGFSALARLRMSLGDVDGAFALVAECDSMTHKFDRCTIEPASLEPTPAVTAAR
jgi:hypothetical protein